MTTGSFDEAPEDQPAPNHAGLVSQLIEAARQGTDEERGQLLEATRRYLLMVAERATDPVLKAKVSPSDLVQETFIDAHRYFSHFEGQSEEELFSWLCRMLLNKVNDAGRKYYGAAKRDLARERPLQVGSRGGASRYAGNGTTPSAVVSGREDQVRLRSALERLPEEYRIAIQLRSWEQLSFAEVGTALNRTADAARKLWFRAVQRLQQELAPEADEQ